ncbi:MAG: two-component sensor histidine kinase [Colwellia sp.]|nr:two-component sensor histidine kinase [Colwellia sp.]
MKRLYVSIVFSVLGSLFLFQWGLDKLVAEHVDIEENNELVLYKQLIEGFSQQLNNSSFLELEATAQQLSQQYQISLSLEKIESVALPSSLHSELAQHGGLLLASESESYILKQLKQHPSILIQLQVPSEPKQDKKFDVLLTAILYFGVCGIIILWLLPLTRRLYLLTSAAAKIGEGNLEVRVPSSKYSYIRRLENSFNRMATQIEKLVADNKILARSLSHDIRTPMSCLRFGVEAALDTNDIDKKNTYINRMEAELTRMEDMTTAFLEYAGMERKGFNLKLESVNLNEFIQTITGDFQSLANQYNLQLSCQLLDKDMNYTIDAHWCYQAIQNLVGNAMQYANNKVILSLSSTAKELIIAIEDDGPGIPTDKLDVIFNPFVKLDANRSREQGHFGLGLAISAKVMDWHNGKITACNSEQYSGACFTLTFPLK